MRRVHISGTSLSVSRQPRSIPRLGWGTRVNDPRIACRIWSKYAERAISRAFPSSHLIRSLHNGAAAFRRVVLCDEFQEAYMWWVRAPRVARTFTAMSLERQRVCATLKRDNRAFFMSPMHTPVCATKVILGIVDVGLHQQPRLC
jgi:hypothetical protein